MVCAARTRHPACKPPLEPMRPPSLLLVLAALVASGSAVAAPPIDLGGGTIEIELQLPDGDGFAPKSDEENEEHFNRANCLCPDVPFALEFSLKDAPAALESEPVSVWFGTQCDSSDPTIRDANC